MMYTNEGMNDHNPFFYKIMSHLYFSRQGQNWRKREKDRETEKEGGLGASLFHIKGLT